MKQCPKCGCKYAYIDIGAIDGVYREVDLENGKINRKTPVNCWKCDTMLWMHKSGKITRRNK